MIIQNDEEYLTTTEVFDKCGVRHYTLNEMNRLGLLKSYHYKGIAKYYKVTEVAAALEKRYSLRENEISMPKPRQSRKSA